MDENGDVNPCPEINTRSKNCVTARKDEQVCFGAGIGRQGSLKNFCESMWVQVPSETPWVSCVAQKSPFPYRCLVAHGFQT